MAENDSINADLTSKLFADPVFAVQEPRRIEGKVVHELLSEYFQDEEEARAVLAYMRAEHPQAELWKYTPVITKK